MPLFTMKTFVITVATVAIATTVSTVLDVANLPNAGASQLTEAELAAYNYYRGTGRRQILS